MNHLVDPKAWVLVAWPRASRFIAMLVLCSAAVSSFAQDALLDRAKQSLAAGDADTAFRMLDAEQDQRAGDPVFDYVLGISALDSGRRTEAIFALERVIGTEPNNALARAELARAYDSLGEKDNARAQLEQIDTATVPPEARSVIERYIALLTSPGGIGGADSETLFRAFVELGIGYDSNVNSATSDSTIPLLVGDTFVPFNLNPDALEAESSFLTLRGGFAVYHPISDRLFAFGGLNGNRRELSEEERFETGNVAGNLGVGYKFSDETTFTASLQGQQFWLDHESFRTAFGVLGQVNYQLDRASQIAGYVQAARLEYTDQPVRDVDRYSGGVTYLRQLQYRYSPTLTVAGYGGTEREQENGVEHLGHNFFGARASLSLELNKQLAVSVFGRYENRNFGGTIPLIGVQRDDDRLSIGALAVYEPIKTWSIRPRIEYINNDSTSQLNQYDRTVVSISVRKDFE